MLANYITDWKLVLSTSVVKSEINPSGMFADRSFDATYDDGYRVATWNRVADYLNACETQSWNYDYAGIW